MTVHLVPATGRRGRLARYLAPAALAILIAALVGVVVSGLDRSTQRPDTATAVHAAVRHLPGYWIVRPGDTFTHIAANTGLSVEQLEAFNPQADPNSLQAGQRLKLWLHPPKPRPRPKGPRFWTVRPGESFGSIAATSGINITKLEQLNPRLKPTMLQPGDRVRLRG